jgi:hypothetical protein
MNNVAPAVHWYLYSSPPEAITNITDGSGNILMLEGVIVAHVMKSDTIDVDRSSLSILALPSVNSTNDLVGSTSMVPMLGIAAEQVIETTVHVLDIITIEIFVLYLQYTKSCMSLDFSTHRIVVAAVMVDRLALVYAIVAAGILKISL